MNGAVRASIALEDARHARREPDRPLAATRGRLGAGAPDRRPRRGGRRHLPEFGCRHTLNLFRSGTGAPVVEPGDLEAVWPTEAEDADGRSWDDAAPASWGLPWSSWERA